jgi:peptidoglycan/xylan/chitin deacetylase (PgdA/CDA1 family)
MSRLESENVTLRWVGRWFMALIFYYTGLLFIYRKIRMLTGRCRILFLCYHSIDDYPNYLDLFMGVSKFDKQVEYLKKNYDVIGIEEAVELVIKGKPLYRDKIVITIDEGYRDNLINAYPILMKYKIEATIFLATEAVNSGSAIFIYKIIRAIERTTLSVLNLEEYGMGTYRLDGRKSKEKVVRAIDSYCRKLSCEAKDRFQRFLLERLCISSVPAMRDNREMLTWEDIKEMSKHGITFGAHTVSHPDLSSLKDEEIKMEIACSKRTIESHTDTKVLYFAYPYGGRASINATAVNAVRKLGFKAGFVLFRNKLVQNNIYELGRVMVSNSMVSSPLGEFSSALFACETSGLFDIILRRFSKVPFKKAFLPSYAD